jgi:hypothetical protein
LKYASNYDELKTERRMCVCGHTRAQHEIFPDEHCYKCDCKSFKRESRKRYIPNILIAVSDRRWAVR